jgi:hypothetical protein
MNLGGIRLGDLRDTYDLQNGKQYGQRYWDRILDLIESLNVGVFSLGSSGAMRIPCITVYRWVKGFINAKKIKQ